MINLEGIKRLWIVILLLYNSACESQNIAKANLDKIAFELSYSYTLQKIESLEISREIGKFYSRL